jgi:hypothetical protein
MANKKHEDWMNSKWRPAMGWMYMAVCTFDFVIFPILWSVLQLYDSDGVIDKQWNPITLSGAGLFHMAMGAVLGVAAWSRGQEKMAGVNGNNMMPTSYNSGMNSPGMMNTGYGNYNQPQATNYESSYTTVTPVGRGYGGKKAPPPAFEPEI